MAHPTSLFGTLIARSETSRALSVATLQIMHAASPLNPHARHSSINSIKRLTVGIDGSLSAAKNPSNIAIN
jgi:hypothetical protein